LRDYFFIKRKKRGQGMNKLWKRRERGKVIPNQYVLLIKEVQQMEEEGGESRRFSCPVKGGA